MTYSVQPRVTDCARAAACQRSERWLTNSNSHDRPFETRWPYSSKKLWSHARLEGARFCEVTPTLECTTELNSQPILR